jgi:MarR family transcriptional regulator, transcriptional regulator for hemolysin
MYEACLLHNRADRMLRLVISSHLQKYKITKMEWLLLALIKEHSPAGAGMTSLASTLGVSMPQITALATNLSNRKLIEQRAVPEDRRAKKMIATKKGYDLAVQIEASMRGALKAWLADIPRTQLEIYMLTVQQLANGRSI